MRKNILNEVMKSPFSPLLTISLSDNVSDLWRLKKDNMVFFHNRLAVWFPADSCTVSPSAGTELELDTLAGSVPGEGVLGPKGPVCCRGCSLDSFLSSSGWSI